MMRFTIFPFLSAALLLSSTAVAQLPITTCPTTETSYSTSDGSVYAICPGSDYQGITSSLKFGITSNTACADLCNKTFGCTKSVFDKFLSICHIKSNLLTLRWVTSTQYDTVRFVTKIVQGASISTCPYPVTSTTVDGSIYQICPGTDYAISSSQVINSVTSNVACTALCERSTGCVKAVYDKIYSICHLKGNPTTTNWVVNKQFDTVQLVQKLAQGSVITECPYQETSYTSSTGAVYKVCPGTDYQVGSSQVIPSITSNSACSDLCEKSSGCTRAVWDKVYSYCHIKGNPSTFTWVVNRQFDAIRKISGSTQSSSTQTKTTSATTIALQSNLVQTKTSTTQTTSSMTQASSSTTQTTSSTTQTTSSTTQTTSSMTQTTSSTTQTTSSTTQTTSSTTQTTSSTTQTTSSTTQTTSSTTQTTSSATQTTSSATQTTSSATQTTSSATQTTSSATQTTSSATQTTSSSTQVSSSTSSSSSSTTISSAQTTSTSTSTSTQTSTTSSTQTSSSSSCMGTSGCVVDSTILVIARDAATARSATSGLNGYGIPFRVLLVPYVGTSLPDLSSSSGGNFGGFIVASQVSYDYGVSNFSSALTPDQWNQLYAYQAQYGVRMVQYGVYPGPAFHTTALGGCCDTGVDQPFAFTDVSDFAQSGLRTGAGVSTVGLYHYPASITNTTTTKEIAQFAANSQFTHATTAAVINDFGTREQMVFFIGFDTDWSSSSSYVQHAYITWVTRGLYAGIRRVNFITQIDDMFLPTDIYYPAGNVYRVTPDDMTSVASWVKTINGKMNAGSSYLPEIGHNGNGNILAAQAVGVPVDGINSACGVGAINTDTRNDTALEFQKPLGTGSDAWPTSPTLYPYTTACLNLDKLKLWFDVAGNRDSFTHISHTFSHYELNNSTYADALKEIQFNQAWFKMAGFTNGQFSADGLIPPAITGLHNGDVLRAWKAAGLTNAVGDNTRPVLRNSNNNMYPYTTNMASNGFDGYQIIPRFATRIYYNCDTPLCTLTEWINTSAGSGTFDNLLAAEKADVTRQLFGLMHDGYMFHQANLRLAGLAPITINGQSLQVSIFQAWVETIVQEFTRLVTWPMISLKQSDLGVSFSQRAARDACQYKLTYNIAGFKITGITVTTSGNVCSAVVPVTVPGPVADTQGFKTEQIGNDPLTIWVQFSGKPVTFTLNTPVSVS